jgi:hypothetical protein
LTQGFGPNCFAAGRKNCLSQKQIRAALVLSQDARRRFNLLRAEIVSIANHRDQFIYKFFGSSERNRVTGQGDLVSANMHFDIRKLALDYSEQSVMRA